MLRHKPLGALRKNTLSNSNGKAGEREQSLRMAAHLHPPIDALCGREKLLNRVRT